MKKAAEAPVWYGAEQASAWADGYNSALEGYSPIPDPYRDTVKKLAAVREKRLAELAEENAQLRTELAKKRPEIFFGTFAEVYGDLDAEDCAMLDREWARWRGYILPTNGTSTLSRPAGEKPSLPVKNDHAAEPQASAATGDESDSRLPLQYEDGPDYCTVKDAQGRDFALTMQPELMRAIERALREDIPRLSQPPVTPTEPQASALSLREALRPFAAVAAVDIGSDEADGDMFSSINHHNAPRLTVGDFRRALAALLAPAEPQAAPELTATCTKLLPCGVLDDSTYSQIEDALDAINAPMTGDGGRYLTISERIAVLNHSKSDTLKLAAEKALNYIENTESELGIKLSCGDALREALTSKGEGNK